MKIAVWWGGYEDKSGPTRHPIWKFHQLKWTDFRQIHAKGVYIIWAKASLRCMKVGRAKLGEETIASRLEAHQIDQNILRYGADDDPLMATWAILDEQYIDGVERYLGERLTPLLGERFPDVEPIEVNLPTWCEELRGR